MARIEAAAKQAVQESVQRLLGPGAGSQVEGIRFDPRLVLPRCSTPLTASLRPNPPHLARQIAEVACGASWRINVPLSVYTAQSVWVARRQMAVGSALVAEDFAIEVRRVAGMTSNRVPTPALPADRRLRRPIVAGTELTFDMIESDFVVRRGQQVVLLARTDRIEIRSLGRALQDARTGERVRAQNLGSLRIVEGQAQSDATISVQP